MNGGTGNGFTGIRPGVRVENVSRRGSFENCLGNISRVMVRGNGRKAFVWR
jgi:hypothetical protein